MDRLGSMYEDSPEVNTLPTKPDAEPGESIERFTNGLSKQHQLYHEQIEQLKAMRANLVDQIEYTDERIRQFETALNRTKRSLQALTGQDEATKSAGGIARTSHERYEDETGIDTLSMPGRNR